MFRLRAGGELVALVTDLEAPTGIGISPDGKALYVASASRGRPIWMAYPVDPDDTLGPGRESANARAYVAPDEGVPDGLKLDPAGNLFAAGPGGARVFAADGARLGRIVTGVPTGNLNWGEDGTVLSIAADHRILHVQTRTCGWVHPTAKH